jgi:hypothetical protein
MADTSSIPDNLEELIASHAKFDGGPDVPENAWVEVEFQTPDGGIFHLLQIPEEGTLGFFSEANNVQGLYFWKQGGEWQKLKPGTEYSLSVHPRDAIVWEYAEGSQADLKLAWWFK